MNLYLLTTVNLGDFYLIASNPLDAQEKLEGELSKANYGFSDDRKVNNIKLIAEQIGFSYNSDKLNFSSKNKLILI